MFRNPMKELQCSAAANAATAACFAPDDDDDPFKDIVCEDSLESWCLAVGVSARQQRTLEALGTTSYLDFLEMTETDKKQLLRGLKMEVVTRNKIMAALDPEALALYHQATIRRWSIDEYAKTNRQRVIRKASNNLTPLVESQSSSESSNYLMMHPSSHIVPHRVVALDRKKAMDDHPNLQESDFVSFNTDTFQIPPGGTVKVRMYTRKN